MTDRARDESSKVGDTTRRFTEAEYAVDDGRTVRMHAAETGSAVVVNDAGREVLWIDIPIEDLPPLGD